MTGRGNGMSPFKTGVIALAVLAIAVFFMFTRYQPFRSDYRVTAVFPSAASEVRARAPVRIAGVNVGEVTEVRRGRGGTAVVEMRITDEGRPLHVDATMRLRPRLFLEGNFFVDVQPGSTSAPELGDGGTIPFGQTAVPVQADEVFQIFTRDTRMATRDVLEGFADALDHGGADALRGGFEEFEGAFTSTAVVAEALRGRRPDDLSEFVRAQARISDRLAGSRRELGRLITSFRGTMDALADRQADLRATVAGADRVLSSAPAALEALDGALPPVRRFAAALRPGLRAAPPVLDRAQPFVDDLAALLARDRLPALASDLAPASRALAQLNVDLVPLLKLVDPVSRCVRDNIVPVLEMQVPDGHLTTDQPVWQEALRVGTGLAGAQANFDGNGTTTRYGGLAAGPNFIASRQTPGDELVMLSDLPMLGSRPPYTPGRQPPLRPDAPCEGQPIPDLRTEATPPPADQRELRVPARRDGG